MNYGDRMQLVDFLKQFKDSHHLDGLVLYTTLILECFAHKWLVDLHTQNMTRATQGRTSEAAERAARELSRKLQTYSTKLADDAVHLKELKAEFLNANPQNKWTHTSSRDKAGEELDELIEALVTNPEFSERILDAILDVAYAGS